MENYGIGIVICRSFRKYKDKREKYCARELKRMSWRKEKLQAIIETARTKEENKEEKSLKQKLSEGFLIEDLIGSIMNPSVGKIEWKF